MEPRRHYTIKPTGILTGSLTKPAFTRCYNPFVYGKVTQTIEKFGLFSLNHPIILGVSGGADSLSLLDCLVHFGYDVIVAHLDHGLRPESPREGQFVEEVSERYRVPFFLRTLEEGALQEQGGSLEEAARLERYKFLAGLAHQHGSRWIAVGHTFDDQVETVLMHLLRGSGPGGLRGMLPRNSLSDWVGMDAGVNLEVARPLIECSRADTEAHCEQLGLTPVRDPSNLNPAFYRNRIRHELLPQLESYNPGIRQVIYRLSSVMREQEDFNQEHVRAVWSRVFKEIPAGGFLIQAGEFKKQHTFLQLSLIRQAMLRLSPGLRDISHDATHRAVAWMSKPEGELSLPGGLSLVRFADDALLHVMGTPLHWDSYPQLGGGVEKVLSTPGEVDLEQGWRVSAIREQTQADPGPWLADTTHQLAVFSGEEFPEAVVVRARKPGDRIQLPAVKGRTKISDLMINRKIPAPLRENWPLVTAGEKVLWVPGIQRSDEMLIAPESLDVIVLKLHPPEEESSHEPSL